MTTRTLMEHGRELLIVTAGKLNPTEVSIWRDDWDYLQALGLSQSWSCLPTGYVIACATKATGNHVTVARVLMDCGPGQGIRYLDGN